MKTDGISEVIEKLNNPKTVEALNSLIDRITELQEKGALDSLLQTIQAIAFMKDSLTDTLVNRNTEIFSELIEIVSEAASPEIKESIRELKSIHRTGNLKDLFDITDTISFAANSTTEKMLERLASIISELGNIANEMAEHSMIEALRELKRLQKSGSLRALVEASDMINFLSNSVTESMVQRIAVFIAAFVEEVVTAQVQDIVKSLTNSMHQTIREFIIKPPKPGIKNLLNTLKDPEVQIGMIFMATFAKNIQKCILQQYSGNNA